MKISRYTQKKSTKSDKKNPPHQNFAVDISSKQEVDGGISNFSPQIAAYCIVAISGDFLVKRINFFMVLWF